jgi:phosphoribosylformimino-5-aminoimidazole carboxamide ribotide isomerase
MEIIPVLDILGGLVVRGFKGERDRYRPINSAIIDSPDPVHVASVLLDITQSRKMYVADLDALQRRGSNLNVLKNLQKETGAVLWIDAGTGKARQVLSLLENVPDCKAVIGSETLETADDFDRISFDCPKERMVFSLDILKGVPLTPEGSPFWHKPVEEGVGLLAGKGWTDVILLTLDAVGTGKGLPAELFSRCSQVAHGIRLFGGGGLRSPDELVRLQKAGVRGILVASALHEQWLTKKDIAELKT